MIVRNIAPEISVVAPAHNEADNLPTLVRELKEGLDQTGKVWEIVVIDDSSSDRTPECLNELCSEYENLYVYRTTKQSGQSAALAAGFDVARGSIIITIDSDLQNDPADIPKLVEQLDRYDVAIGWRRDRKDPISKKIISKIANAIRNWATGECVKDTGCGLKAFKSETLRPIPRFNGMHRFFPTLVKMYGATVAEIPVNHRPRTQGKTHYNILNRSIRPIMDLLAIRWFQRRCVHPQIEPVEAPEYAVK